MLTKQQQKLLTFIYDEMYNRGVCPSYEEMGAAMSLKSKSGVHRLIISLEERGFIRRLPNRARALEILKRADDLLPPHMSQKAHPMHAEYGMGQSVAPSMAHIAPPPPKKDFKLPFMDTAEVPMLGKIAAGTPIETISTPDYNIGFPMSMLGNAEEHYALQVDGDSMAGAGIHDGDTVLVAKCSTARDGDVVVALVDREEATLKTLFRHGKEIHLQPANPNYETQVYDTHRVQIQGRLIGLLRIY